VFHELLSFTIRFILAQVNKELEQRLKKANADNARLAGHQNARQKIQYMADLKNDHQLLNEVCGFSEFTARLSCPLADFVCSVQV
jgi:hypothetical protein